LTRKIIESFLYDIRTARNKSELFCYVWDDLINFCFCSTGICVEFESDIFPGILIDFKDLRELLRRGKTILHACMLSISEILAVLIEERKEKTLIVILNNNYSDISILEAHPGIHASDLYLCIMILSTAQHVVTIQRFEKKERKTIVYWEDYRFASTRSSTIDSFIDILFRLNEELSEYP